MTKAAFLSAYGPIANVVVRDVALAPPAADEVLVRVAAAAVNPLDGKLVAGTLADFFPLAFPAALGTDFAGVVEATGALVSEYAPGDRVVGRLDPVRGGAFAETVVAPARLLARAPEGMPSEMAAALATVAPTAWQALFEAGQLRAGERLLVRGRGAVATVARQLAERAGAVLVDADADVVLDTTPAAVDLTLLRAGGRWLTIVVPPDAAAARAAGKSAAFVFHASDGARLGAALAACASHAITVPLDRTFPLAETAAAIAHVSGPNARGKTLISR